MALGYLSTKLGSFCDSVTHKGGHIITIECYLLKRSVDVLIYSFLHSGVVQLDLGTVEHKTSKRSICLRVFKWISFCTWHVFDL